MINLLRRKFRVWLGIESLADELSKQFSEIRQIEKNLENKNSQLSRGPIHSHITYDDIIDATPIEKLNEVKKNNL